MDNSPRQAASILRWEIRIRNNRAGLLEQFFTRPIFVTGLLLEFLRRRRRLKGLHILAIWHVPANNEGDLLLIHLFDGNL